MSTIAGYATSGRRLKGPASDIVELIGEDGKTLSAIVFHPEYREHRGINGALEVVARFLEQPMVGDLVEMVARDPEQGAFVYATGQVWAVADVIRILADLGETAGVRAGLELMLRAGRILTEAADFGASENVYSHGGLTPWRLVMHQDGRVQVLGHALPQVEILMFHEDHTVLPPSDSFRYCPPERIHGEEEDLSSDLFSLGLIAFEFMTGKPVYDGLVNDIRQQAARGEAGRVLFRARESLPASVRDILGNAMRLEVRDRHPDGYAFLDAVEAALHSGDARGPSLAEVMRKVSSQMQRRGVVPDSASTVMGTPAEIMAMLGSDDDDDEPVLAPKREKWQPPGRVSRASPVAPAEPAQAPPSSEEPDVGGSRWSAAVRRSGTRRPIRRSAPTAPSESLPAAPSIVDEQPSVESSPASRFNRVSGVRRVNRTSAVASQVGPAPDAAPGSPVDIQKVLRSSRIRKPRRNRTPADLAAEEAPGEAVPVPAPVEELVQPPPAPAPRSTADLLAQIRQSATRSRRSSVDRPSAAGDIIRDLVRSSGRTRTSAEAEDVPAAPSLAPSSGGSARVRTVRRNRRSTPTAEAVEEEALAGPSSVADTPVAPPEKPAPAVVAPPIPVLDDRNEAVDEPSAAPPTPAAVPSDLAGQPTQKLPVPEEPVTTPSVSATTGHVGNLQRPPSPIPTDARSGGAKAFVIRRGPDGRGTRMRLPKNATAAEAIGWLVGNLVPVRTDLTGRLTGWYRFSSGDNPVPPDTLLDRLDGELPLVLYTVPNDTRLVDLRIEGEPTTRFVSPMGTAVPVVTLIDHITAWLDLSPDTYSLVGPTGPLGPYHILADLSDVGGLLSLVLKRTPAEASS